MTKEEKLAKMRAARKPKGTSIPPTILMKEFDLKGEHFERLYFEEDKNLAVFRRSYANSGVLIAYELVIGKGKELNYPCASDFGKLGWCFAGGSDERCKELLKNKRGIIL